MVSAGLARLARLGSDGSAPRSARLGSAWMVWLGSAGWLFRYGFGRFWVVSGGFGWLRSGFGWFRWFWEVSVGFGFWKFLWG